MSAFYKSIKGGALVYAILFMFICGVLLTILFQLADYTKKLEHAQYKKNQLQYNLKSGLAIASSIDFDYSSSWVAMKLFGDINDSVAIKKVIWGEYDIAACISYSGNDSIYSAQLLGNKFVPEYSLYISEQNSPISIGGTTKLSGKLFIPKKGLKRANINDQPYERTRIHYGSVSKSKKDLPSFKHQYFSNLMYINENVDDQIIYRNYLIDEDFTNSFKNNSITIEASNNLSISNCTISGNIKILCNGEVYIDSTSNISGVIIYCDMLYVDEGFKGDFQAYARDSAIIEENCILKYPSSIISMSKNDSSSLYIKLGEHSSLAGSLVAFEEKLNRKNMPTIALMENSVFQGYLYTNGYLDARGVIAGQASCRKTIYKNDEISAENTLINAIINQHNIHPEFCVGTWMNGPLKLVKECQ